MPSIRDQRRERRDIVIATRTQKGILIQSSKRKDFIEAFKKVIMTEPERTGKPENWTPEKMKEILESRV